MTITTIVYDIGQVLIMWDPTRVWSKTMTPAQVKAFLAESEFVRVNHDVDAGRSIAEAVARIAETSPEHAATFRHYFDNFEESLAGTIPGSHELVAELAEGGYRLLGLSNWSRETFHHALETAPALRLMEDIIVSGRVGLAKPDPAIFNLLISTFDLDPAASVFIDDSTPNIVAARASGLQAILFTDVPSLRADLIALGVKVTPAAN